MKKNYITKYEREHGLLIPQEKTNTKMEIQHISISTLIKVTKKCNCEYCGYSTEESFYINSKDDKNTNISSNNICPQCNATLTTITQEEIVNSKEINELNNSTNTNNNNSNQDEINRKKKEHGYKNMFKWGLALTIIFGLATISILGSEDASSALGGVIPTIIGIVLIVRSKKMLKQMKLVKEKN